MFNRGIIYAIALFMDDEYSIIYGPYPTLDQAREQLGEEYTCLIRTNDDGTVDRLSEWDEEQFDWSGMVMQ